MGVTPLPMHSVAGHTYIAIEGWRPKNLLSYFYYPAVGVLIDRAVIAVSYPTNSFWAVGGDYAMIMLLLYGFLRICGVKGRII